MASERQEPACARFLDEAILDLSHFVLAPDKARQREREVVCGAFQET
jgi:hypothetical protein